MVQSQMEVKDEAQVIKVLGNRPSVANNLDPLNGLLQ